MDISIFKNIFISKFLNVNNFYLNTYKSRNFEIITKKMSTRAREYHTIVEVNKIWSWYLDSFLIYNKI